MLMSVLFGQEEDEILKIWLQTPSTQDEAGISAKSQITSDTRLIKEIVYNVTTLSTLCEEKYKLFN